MTYWAHSAESPADWQRLSDHLVQVAALARELAKGAAPADTQLHELAYRVGLLHDYGKYTECFQQRINGENRRCPHAIHGAALIYARLKAGAGALAIAGHHAGIPNGDKLGDGIKKALQESLGLLKRAIGDCPELGRVIEEPFKLGRPAGSQDLFTRMLFSCLVDADRLDTAKRRNMQAPLEPQLRLNKLLEYVAGLKTTPVSSAREGVLKDCRAAAARPERLLSLSVPTGGGKTLSGMAFALQRAAFYPEQYRRIIVVIPYLSIIEQNAGVYTDIFGQDAVLEHHSGTFDHLTTKRRTEGEYFVPAEVDEQEYRQPDVLPETENWDAPLIVTTSVRFFESLFSNRPSDLRRVHNVARSIVILDEVQVLPRPLLSPLLHVIRELVEHWGCTFVLSTATKPGFERAAMPKRADPRWPTGTVQEIVSEPVVLYKQLRRVTIEWRTKQPVDWPNVAGWMAEHQQALCIVNVKEHASVLFDELRRVSTLPTDSIFHLSTRMCPAHRLQEIEEIRYRLDKKLPCLVASTQLIEAGVDVDFPIAFRAIGPLDAIIQTGGRVDRNGRATASAGGAAGRLIVFQPLDHRTPPNDYFEATELTRILSTERNIQCDDLDAMTAFFDRYYGDPTALGLEYQELRDNRKFAELADKFEMISTRTRDVFVPFDDGKSLIDELWKIRRLTSELRRQLQRYTVGLLPGEFYAAGAFICEVGEGTNVWVASEAAYSLTKGLELSISPENLMY